MTGDDPRTRAVTLLPDSSRKKPRIVPPQSNSLLASVQAFLPQIQAANQQVEADLARGVPSSKFDIEAVEDDEPHIEMKLHLGVGEEVKSGSEMPGPKVHECEPGCASENALEPESSVNITPDQ